MRSSNRPWPEPARSRSQASSCRSTAILASYSPLAETPVEIVNVANLRVKESDRLATVSSELRKLAARPGRIFPRAELRSRARSYSEEQINHESFQLDYYLSHTAHGYAEGPVGAVVPVALVDRVEHPGHEDDELRQHGQQEPPPAGVDPHAQHDLERGGDDEAPGQETDIGQVPHAARPPRPGPGG